MQRIQTATMPCKVTGLYLSWCVPWHMVPRENALGWQPFGGGPRRAPCISQVPRLPWTHQTHHMRLPATTAQHGCILQCTLDPCCRSELWRFKRPSRCMPVQRLRLQSPQCSSTACMDQLYITQCLTPSVHPAVPRKTTASILHHGLLFCPDRRSVFHGRCLMMRTACMM